MAASSESDKTDENKTIQPDLVDVKSFSQRALQAVIGAVRSSNDLPCAGNDWDYYSSFPSFRELMNIEGRRLTQMMHDVLRHQNVKGSLVGQEAELEERFDSLVDGNDVILERVGSLLDEASGVKKTDAKLVVASVASKTISTSWNKQPSASTVQSSSYRLLAARYIQRPQLKFQDKIDNSHRLFVPKLTRKPNAVKPLPDNWLSNEDEDDGDVHYPHPYQHELDHLVHKPEQLTKVTPKEPLSVSETPLIMVSTVSELEQMNLQLKKETEIAVDLEHHSYRTFLGLTCLMQVSTRSQDYIVDCLELRSHLQLLNEVFTDPSIVKVFHGCDMDIDWLQRDLGLYVVNMFDTGQASRLLNFARFSLAYLLQHYCGVLANKQYQLADWRIRPLPDELVQYAREDTHYLLYIYDKMKNELLERGNEHGNLLHSVLQRSTQLCSRVYHKPVCNDDSHLELLYKSKKMFNSQQILALKSLYNWRDKLARQEDESTGYVLPNHMLLQIAEILPRESQGILACCNPIPPLVKQDLADLHRLVLEARDTPLQKVTARSAKKSLPSMEQHPKYNAGNILTCLHDLSHQAEYDSSLQETLLDPQMVATQSSFFKADSSTIQIKTSPIISALAWSPEKELKKCNKSTRAKAARIISSFSSPFMKFLPSSSLNVHGSKEKLSLKQSDVDRIHLVNQCWKLMKNTPKEVKPTTGAGHINKNAVDVLAPQPSSDELITPMSLRQQMSTSSKQKKKAADDFLDNLAKELQGSSNPPMEETEKKRKRKTDSGAEVGVQSYEYSKTDMKMFEEIPRKKQKKSKKEFNPDEIQHKFKAPHKSRLNPSSGKKSMTFSSHRSQQSQQEWPKR